MSVIRTRLTVTEGEAILLLLDYYCYYSITTVRGNGRRPFPNTTLIALLLLLLALLRNVSYTTNYLVHTEARIRVA